MSAVDRFDQRFTGLLEDLGAASYPDYFDDALEVAMHRTQRPTWTFPERWLPMGVLAQRRTMVPSVPWRIVGLVAVLALLAAALVVALGSQRRVPPPFGIAANGVVAVAHDGDIYVRDTVDGTERLIVGGDQRDGAPLFSRDGTRLAFYRAAVNESADGGTLYVAAPDGSDLRALFGPDHIHAGAWSPSGDTFAVIAGEPRSLWMVPADGSEPTGPIDLAGVTPYAQMAWRPPDGKELVFEGIDKGLFALYAVAADGSTPPRRLTEEYADELGPSTLSPDGTQLVRMELGDRVRLSTLDLERGSTTSFGVQLPAMPTSVSPEHMGNAQYSPDGKQIVFGRYWDERGGEINHQLWVTSADGDGSDAIPVGPVHRSRSGHDPFWYAYAPDGKNVLMLGNESEEAWLVPVDRSDPGRLDVDWGLVDDPPEWQRLAP